MRISTLVLLSMVIAITTCFAGTFSDGEVEGIVTTQKFSKIAGTYIFKFKDIAGTDRKETLVLDSEGYFTSSSPAQTVNVFGQLQQIKARKQKGSYSLFSRHINAADLRSALIVCVDLKVPGRDSEPYWFQDTSTLIDLYNGNRVFKRWSVGSLLFGN